MFNLASDNFFTLLSKMNNIHSSSKYLSGYQIAKHPKFCISLQSVTQQFSHPILSKASVWPAALLYSGLSQWDPMKVNTGRGQYISWTLIGWLTFTTLPSGMGRRTSEGERRSEIRLWVIRLMKEEKRVKGQGKVALRQISLEDSWTNCSDSLREEYWDTDWQRRNESQDALSVGERNTLNVLFWNPININCWKVNENSAGTQKFYSCLFYELPVG